MLSQRNGVWCLVRSLCVLAFLPLLTHPCRGQSHLIGPSQPIVAKVGDDIILPCYLEPEEDVTAMTLEWTRADLDPIFVHVRRLGEDLEDTKHPSFEKRTSLSVNELRRGNVSLKLNNVKPTDTGRYECYISKLDTRSFVELVVGVASSPVISLSGIDRNSGGVVLQCDSTGWYPEPEVFWLDGEGNLLSAGPPETVRGPDDLYTVSSRVTVEKRHSNSFTCRVTQKKTNQTRETEINISDDFFEVQSGSSSTTTILAAVLAVTVTVCILLILVLVFFVWRQNKPKTKQNSGDETDKGKKPNQKKINKPEGQIVTEEEKEREQLMPGQTKVEMKECNKGKKKQKKKDEEQQRREAAENKVKPLKEKLETKKREVEEKQSVLQQLHEEVKKNKEEVKTMKEQLEKKNKELEDVIKELSQFHKLDPRKLELQKKKKEVKNQVDKLMKHWEMTVTELHAKTQEIHVKQGEVQKLQDEIQKMLTDLQTRMEELGGSSDTKAETQQTTNWWPFGREKQRREEAEERIKDLEGELPEKKMEDEQPRGQEAEEEVQENKEPKEKTAEGNHQTQTESENKVENQASGHVQPTAPALAASLYAARGMSAAAI